MESRRSPRQQQQDGDVDGFDSLFGDGPTTMADGLGNFSGFKPTSRGPKSPQPSASLYQAVEGDTSELYKERHDLSRRTTTPLLGVSVEIVDTATALPPCIKSEPQDDDCILQFVLPRPNTYDDPYIISDSEDDDIEEIERIPSSDSNRTVQTPATSVCKSESSRSEPRTSPLEVAVSEVEKIDHLSGAKCDVAPVTLMFDDTAEEIVQDALTTPLPTNGLLDVDKETGTDRIVEADRLMEDVQELRPVDQKLTRMEEMADDNAPGMMQLDHSGTEHIEAANTEIVMEDAPDVEQEISRQPVPESLTSGQAITSGQTAASPATAVSRTKRGLPLAQSLEEQKRLLEIQNELVRTRFKRPLGTAATAGVESAGVQSASAALSSIDLGNTFLRPSVRAHATSDNGNMSKPASGHQQVIEAGPSASGSQDAKVTLPEHETTSDDAWMHGIDEDDDADEPAEASFRALKEEYEKKKAAGRNTVADNVRFLNAEKAHANWLRNKHRRQGETEPVADVEQTMGNGLFVSSEEPSKVDNNMIPVEDMDTDGMDIQAHDPLALSNDPTRVSCPDRFLEGIDVYANDFRISMAVAMETEMAKARKKDKKSKNKTTKSATDSVKDARITKAKGKDKGKDKGKEPAGKGEGKGGGKKGKAKTGPEMTNINSILNSNIYEEANANLEKRDLAVIEGVVKRDDMLSQLIASVPLEERRFANVDRTHIKKAVVALSKTMPRNSVGTDGKGYWKIKGMDCSIRHHQILGISQMVKQELEEDHGGMLCDAPGLGKTIQMIGTMVCHKPKKNMTEKTTLIVAAPNLLTQWQAEMARFVEKDVLGKSIFRYKKSAQTFGSGTLDALKDANIVFTTYQEVRESYPKYDPPASLSSLDAKKRWWEEHFLKNRGELHSMKFFRVVLDEAHYIKNHESRTSQACRALVAEHRWVISGTPAQNGIDEIYPYLRFLKIKNVGSYDLFVKNFCMKDNAVCSERLQAMLRRVMIRRSHGDQLFGAPIVKLPRNNQRTIVVEFNNFERAIYNTIRSRFLRKIEVFKRQNLLYKKYHTVLVMLLRLRQLTTHVGLIERTLKSIFSYDEIEELFNITERTPAHDNFFQALRNSFVKKESGEEADGALNTTPPVDPDLAASDRQKQLNLRESFRKLLKNVKSAEQVKDRSVCHKCFDAPEDPYVTSCFHIYCHDCLIGLMYEASVKGEDRSTCLECGQAFDRTEAVSCKGLKELDSMADPTGTSRSAAIDVDEMDEHDNLTEALKAQEDPYTWIKQDGPIFPSAKLEAMTVQLRDWIREAPTDKTIIFTQWYGGIILIRKICEANNWAFCEYHGKMSHKSREATIEMFQDKPEIRIMIASLKCGGLGLNLTMAQRVIALDLWFNSAVEQQAFARVFRIGQTKETYITRLVVRNTIDERLEAMQKAKSKDIDNAMGDDASRRSGRLSIEQLTSLFDDSFILPEGDDEYDENGRPTFLPEVPKRRR